MNSKITIHNLILILILLNITGCNNALVKDDSNDEQIDLFEIERQANQAYENNDWVESEKHYQILVEKVSENAEHWFRLGNIYASTQRPDPAVRAYREALVRDPKYSKAWYNLGVLHLRQAANSFDQYQLYVDKNDPLYEKSMQIFTDTLNILKGESAETK